MTAQTRKFEQCFRSASKHCHLGHYLSILGLRIIWVIAFACGPKIRPTDEVSTRFRKDVYSNYQLYNSKLKDIILFFECDFYSPNHVKTPPTSILCRLKFWLFGCGKKIVLEFLHEYLLRFELSGSQLLSIIQARSLSLINCSSADLMDRHEIVDAGRN